MKILVHFKSGFKQTFIVPKYMLALEFRNMAKEIGGSIASIEFSLPLRRQTELTSTELRNEVFRLPDER
ncbi:hypothetical protein [Nitrosomonas supralitoralis]|uniref:Uncharacterized protein n=1 Tax=Nitrosomonas supralitoralis TaxID=2116706 RepID=A0A2P7NYS1_9PROT|nr:hypothetical protein [Nitrosomonas supralitoralis]PSJ18577.1 hypothetical protein C7H79_01930 [Nitrosomonas supralitoralis]